MPLWFGQTQDYVAALRNGDKVYTENNCWHVKRHLNATEIGLPETGVRSILSLGLALLS